MALCDQVEPQAAKGKKLIRREVVRLITPGTVTDTGLLDGRRNNFLAAVAVVNGRLGAALVDITTADFWAGESVESATLAETLLVRRPAELLVAPTLGLYDPLVVRFREAGVLVTVGDRASFTRQAAEDRLRAHFRVATLDGLAFGPAGAATVAAGATPAYLHETQQVPPAHLTRIGDLVAGDHLVLDELLASRNLEVVESLHDRGARGTLPGDRPDRDPDGRTPAPRAGRSARCETRRRSTGAWRRWRASPRRPRWPRRCGPGSGPSPAPARGAAPDLRRARDRALLVERGTRRTDHGCPACWISAATC